MAYRRVSAGNGVRWLTDAARLIGAQPAPFLSMGVVVAAIAALPVLGTLLLAVFGPALYAGIAYAAHEQASGRQARFEHLFSGFQQPGKLPRLVLLCLPGLAAGLLLATLLVITLGSLLSGTDPAQVTDPEALAAAGLGAAALPFLVLAVVIGLAAYALVFFAAPRLMLTDAEPFTAMRDSLAACLANLGAFLLFIVALLAGSMLLGLLLGWMPTLLAQLLLMSLLVPLVSAGLYFAWRDVFDDLDTGRPPTAPPTIAA